MAELSVVQMGMMGFGLVFGVVGLAIVNKGRTMRNRGERIAETETTPIADLRPGTAQVEGTARPTEAGDGVESPISRTGALATYVSARANRTSATGMETIYDDRDAVPFVVDDGTGQVRVEPATEGFDFETERTSVGFGERAPEAIRGFVDRTDGLARSDPDDASNRESRAYEEGYVEPGDDVYVFGDVREAGAGWDRTDYVVDGPATTGEFVLSHRSGDHQAGKRNLYGLLLYVFGACFAAFGTLFAAVWWLGGF